MRYKYRREGAGGGEAGRFEVWGLLAGMEQTAVEGKRTGLKNLRPMEWASGQRTFGLYRPPPKCS